MVGPNFTCTCNCQNCIWISMTLRWFQILIDNIFVSTSIQQVTDRWFQILAEKNHVLNILTDGWFQILTDNVLLSIGHPCYGRLTPVKKNTIHWPVSCDHITGSSLVFIEMMCLVFKLTTDQGLVFSWIAGSCQVNLLEIVWNQVKANQAKYKLHCEQMFCIAFVVWSSLRYLNSKQKAK